MNFLKIKKNNFCKMYFRQYYYKNKNMQSVKFLYLFFIIFSFLTVGCLKEKPKLNIDFQETEYIAFCDEAHNTDGGNYLDITWFTFDGTVIDADKPEDAAVKYSFILDEDVTYSYTVREKVSGSNGVISMSAKDYSGKLKESAFIETQLNKVQVVRDGLAWKLLVNGSYADTGPNPSGQCPEGTWYSPACGDPKGVIWKFGSDNKGSFSNKDCNGICSPMVFTFSYKMSGTTCSITYDALQPIVTCTGYQDSRPPTPKPASITLSCSNDKLTVTSGNGTQVFTK